MPLTPVTYYEVTCDKCGSDVGGDYCAWKQKDAAINEADNCDWWIWIPSESPAPESMRIHCHACPPLCEGCGEETDAEACERDYKCQICWIKSEMEPTT